MHLVQRQASVSSDPFLLLNTGLEEKRGPDSRNQELNDSDVSVPENSHTTVIQRIQSDTRR